MTSRFRLDRGNDKTRQLVERLAEQVERDRDELERVCIGHDGANHLRGRLSAWRELQGLAAPPREVKIDGKAV